MSLTKNIPMYTAKYVYKQDLWFNVFNNLPFLSKSFPTMFFYMDIYVEKKVV